MASHHLPQLTFASTQKPSIALILVITTAFLVPFLAFSTPPAFQLILSTLTSTASALRDSSLSIFTSSPFYFFLLNFLIFALLLSSGILTRPSPRAGDDVQEGDLQYQAQHDYHSATQITSERLALDELYGSQVSSVPYLHLTERSNVHIRDDHPLADEEEANRTTSCPNITPSLQPGPTDDKDAENKGNSALEDGEKCKISSPKIDNRIADGSAFTDSISLGGSEAKMLSANGSLGTNNEIHQRNMQDEPEGKQIISTDGPVDCTAYDDENGDDGGDHKESTASNVDSHTGGGEVAPSPTQEVADIVESNCVGTGSHGDGVNAEEVSMAKTGSYSACDEEGGENAGAGSRESVGWGKDAEEEEEEVNVSQEKEEEEQQQNKREEEEEEANMMMSAEELNERASAFISAFRRKLTLDS